MAISLSFVRTVADSDAHVAHGASAKNLRGQRFANVFGLQVRLDIFGTRNGVSRQRDQDVTDDDASLVGRPIGLNFENDGSGFLFVLHRLAQLFRETDRLQSHAEIAARDAALFQQGFGDTIDSGSGYRNSAESRKARRSDSEDSAVRINYGAANSGGLQANVKPDVWGERGASPGAAFRDNEAHDSKRRHGATGACPPHDKRDAARLDG